MKNSDKDFATKKDIDNLKVEMTSQINKLVTKKDAKKFATKQDLNGVKQDVSGLKQDVIAIKNDISEMKTLIVDLGNYIRLDGAKGEDFVKLRNELKSDDRLENCATA